jgi:hypothetical protein
LESLSDSFSYRTRLPSISKLQHYRKVAVIEFYGRFHAACNQTFTIFERWGTGTLEDIQPITIAAYIETLQRRAASPTVKLSILAWHAKCVIRPHSPQNEQTIVWPTFIFHRRIALGL